VAVEPVIGKANEIMGRVSDARQRLMQAVLQLIWSGSYGSTTIDQICDKAGVKKGSFYYFFKSKADVAVAALEADWQTRRPDLDSLFSPTVPPLERLKNFSEFAYRKQTEVKKGCGCVLGCALFTLGAEICTQEKDLRCKIQEILGSYRKYLESAIRDAQAAGLIEVSDVPAKARMLFAYYEGVLTQARIQNDAEVLRDLPGGMCAFLGIKSLEAIAV
jgi:TetR/AcrR family transcriptional regulator, transcriptional repressor for nem operon